MFLGESRREEGLTGRVGAGAGAVSSAAGRSRAAADRGAAPRRPRPAPHSGRGAPPHGRWRGQSSRRGGQSSRGCPDDGGEDGGHCDLLPVDLTSVHVLEGLLGLLGRLKLHVGVALGQVWLHPVHGHLDVFDLAVGGEDLLDVLLDDVPGESAQRQFGGFGSGAPPAPLPLVFLCRFRLGA